MRWDVFIRNLSRCDSEARGKIQFDNARWYHLVGVWERSTSVRVYVNGAFDVQDAVSPCAQEPLDNAFPLLIGKIVSGQHFCGLIDDVRIYNRALSEVEVQGLYEYEYESQPQPSIPHRATAIAEVVNGFVVGLTITDYGFGYTNNPPPAVRIRDAEGSGATAHAIVENGQVVRLEVDSNGRGYSGSAVVVIAPPPFWPTLSIDVSRVRVNMNVVLGRRYRLDSSPDLQTWTPTGDSFVAEDDVVVQEFDVVTTGRYFRIQEVP